MSYQMPMHWQNQERPVLPLNRNAGSRPLATSTGTKNLIVGNAAGESNAISGQDGRAPSASAAPRHFQSPAVGGQKLKVFCGT